MLSALLPALGALQGEESLLTSADAVASAATTLVIGQDPLYWDAIPSDPTEYSVEVGTALEFRFSSYHNVHLSQTEEDFADCDVASSVELASIETGGGMPPLTNLFTAVVNATGEFYFLCAIYGHCSFGQKIKVTVTATSSGGTNGLLGTITDAVAEGAQVVKDALCSGHLAGRGPCSGPLPSEADLAYPFYGFPKCYLSFPGNGAETEWLDDRPHYEMRPVEGQAWFPYEGSSEDVCAVVKPSLAALGPHWSPIGLELYQPTTERNALPEQYRNRLFIASHGSWNRGTWIGYDVDVFDIDRSDPNEYKVISRQSFVPPLRDISTGQKIRPVDLKSSPVDGSLLMTADWDDWDPAGNGGGLYRITYNATDADPARLVPMPNSGDDLADGDDLFALERLASIPCARTITHSRADPTVLYIGTFQGFCIAGGGGRIWTVQLEPLSGLVQSFAPLIEGLYEPNGVEWHPGISGASPFLVMATDSRSTSGRGNCIVSLPDPDALSAHVLGGGHAVQVDDERLENLACGYTAQQSSHSWRAVRMMPDDHRLILNVGANCNWATSCLDGPNAEGDMSYQTTLLALDPATGETSILARGIRNTLGFKWDDNGNLLFVVFGSDSASGIPGASLADTANLPDCQLNVLYGADVP